MQDTVCIQRCRRIYVCVYCSTRRNITGGQLQCAKIRMDCTDKGRLLCANCEIPSILEVDILGRVAHIGDQKLVLSVCCASIIYYKGTGNEFNLVCGPQCARENQFSKGRTLPHQESKQSHPAARNAAFCYVCQQKNTSNSFQLLHIPTRKLQVYFLCSKHNMAPSIVKRLGDERDLVAALQVNRKMAGAAPTAAQQHPRRGGKGKLCAERD